MRQRCRNFEGLSWQLYVDAIPTHVGLRTSFLKRMNRFALNTAESSHQWEDFPLSQPGSSAMIYYKCAFFTWISVVALLLPALGAELPRGLVIQKKTWQSDKFASATEFFMKEEFPQIINFVTQPGAKPSLVLRADIIQVVDYLEFNNRIFSTEADRIVLDQTILSYEAISSQYPQAAAFLNPKILLLREWTAALVAGDVILRGKTVSRHELNAQRTSSVSSAPTAIPALEYDGLTMRQVRVTAVRGDRISVIHDGGVASLALSSVSPAQLELLKASAPALFDQQSFAGTSSPTQPPPDRGPGLIEVSADGVGETADEALRDALREAVWSTVGAFLSAEQIVRNEELISDQVVAYSDAFVQGYDRVSEKRENGLYHISIKARVVRAKMAQHLSKSGLKGHSELQGENMFAEAVTRLDKTAAAKDLLGKLFQGFPQSVSRATLLGKPAIIAQTETTATLRLRVRVGIDSSAYTAWHQKAADVFKQICSSAKPFQFPRVQVKYPDHLRKAFINTLYGDEPPTANDDDEIARFNPRLDGLIPILGARNLGLERLRVGMTVCLSKTFDDFRGDAYTLGEDEYSAITAALKPQNNERSAWRCLEQIEVNFKNENDDIVRQETLDLSKRELQYGSSWLAPYGMMQHNGDTQVISGTAFGRHEERLMLVQPAFILSDARYWLVPANISENSHSAYVATSGVAFDFTLELPLSDLRQFHHVDLQWKDSE